MRDNGVPVFDVQGHHQDVLPYHLPLTMFGSEYRIGAELTRVEESGHGGHLLNLDLVGRFLGDSAIGLFGAGHLGRAIAKGLLTAGLPRKSLIICHRGSEETARELEAAGLGDLVADREHVVGDSRILLYLVRPQDRRAISNLTPRQDSLFISFLAGTPLGNLPVHLPDTQRVRVMTSAPDTLLQRNGIAGLYPSNNVVVREMLEALGLRIIALGQESDIHAFTALGPCLPIVLMYWEGAGHKINDKELLQMGNDWGLSGYLPILQWALNVRPRGLSLAEAHLYLAQATTPGGVTDSILSAVRTGLSLPAALRRGIERSQQLAAT